MEEETGRMAEDTSEETGKEKFTIELTPSEMYSLSTILKYNTINMEDGAYARTSEVLAEIVHESMASEEFETAMEDEMEAYKEENNFDDLEARFEGKPIGGGVQ